MEVTLLLFALISSFHVGGAAECDRSAETCEFWLDIQERLTMQMGTTRVSAKKGKLYKFGEENDDNAVPVFILFILCNRPGGT